MSRFTFLANVLTVTLLVILGYLVFRVFVTQIASGPEAYGLIAFALVAGIATFFSPCSFPVLPAYLTTLFSKRDLARKANYYGVSAAAGIVAFNVILGLIIGLAGTALAGSLSLTSLTPNPFTQSVRTAIGILILFLGLVQFTGTPFFYNWFHRIGAKLSSTEKISSIGGFFFYGFGYTAAGLGCSGPIMAGLVAFSMASGGLVVALSTFIVYSLTMSSLMILITILASRASKQALTRITRASRKISKTAGMVQIVVGVFLIYTALETNLFRRIFFP
ncbi:hypothetical protein HY546_01460 [archaeon]|nr:hypothetical protein [archaeon]